MNIRDLVVYADEYAKEEIKQYGAPEPNFYEIAMEKGIWLAEQLSADVDIVKIGTALMDCGLGRAKKNGTPEEHAAMSVEKTKEILRGCDFSEEIKGKIVNCVAAHHGTIPYLCIEAEICANADCYKFLYPRCFFTGINLFYNRFNDLDKTLEHMEERMNEKYNIMSLDMVKEELEEYFHQFKNLIEVAKHEHL
ncbi:MAG: hypothetical protein LBG64_02250 [Pseudomonadales bacterium]|jgi:hypothetical protein|nr:hypothetical protein [Pseudomonadales bacterium]